MIAANLTNSENSLQISAAATDYTEVNLNIVLNIITLSSTFITCSSATITPFALGSCVFNTLAFITSLMLNILVGMDSIPDGSTTSDLFGGIGCGLNGGLVQRLNSFGELFVYEVRDDGMKCVSVTIGKLGSSSMPGVQQSVCITSEGLDLISTPHKISIKGMTHKLGKKLKKEDGTVEANQVSKIVNTYSKYGSFGSAMIDKLGEIQDAYLNKQLSDVNRTLSVNVDHNDQTMLQIALKLL
ncbi:hypothetical protein C6P45_003637 [Maudiozyma exigua]|uniref:Uncharacterized protein n=1 Tax=Maudiozyma exigua TaxID=34358 RepID=A0A9P6VSS0_MAUEX|nr:hypothetical protein C6P45_003637 [Kazachstania exigua]